MSNLLLTIIFTSWLLISFRVFALFNIDNLQAIIFNYIVCVIIGFSFFNNYQLLSHIETLDTWIIFALLTGACFLPSFYLMSYTVKKISVTVSTIASKTSLIIPVSVSILYLNSDVQFTAVNLIGLSLGLGAILLSSLKFTSIKKTNDAKIRSEYFLPILVFIGAGLVDVLINITNFKYLPTDQSSLFPFFAFSVAAVTGITVLAGRMIFLNEKIKLRNILGGIVLGVPNYLSIFFLLKTLQNFNNNGALIFPMLNICVIFVNAFVAILFFKEKLSLYNYIGLFLAVISLLFLVST
jgi:drug/metabolite transporter (DMT)-like permease